MHTCACIHPIVLNNVSVSAHTLVLIVLVHSIILFTKKPCFFVLHRKLVSEQSATEIGTAAAKVYTCTCDYNTVHVLVPCVLYM